MFGLFINFYYLLQPNFLASYIVKNVSITLSTIILISILGYNFHLIKEMLMGARKAKKLLKGLSITFLMSFIVFSYFYIIFAVTIPRTMNEVVGTEVKGKDVATKKTSTSSRGCQSYLNFEESNGMFFEYCIPKSTFDSFPEGESEVILEMKQSFWGRKIMSVRQHL